MTRKGLIRRKTKQNKIKHKSNPTSVLSKPLEIVPGAPTTITITLPPSSPVYFFFWLSRKIKVFVNFFAFFHFHPVAR